MKNWLLPTTIIFTVIVTVLMGAPQLFSWERVPAFGFDGEHNICLLEYTWGTNCCLWQIDSVGNISFHSNDVYDPFWELDTNGYYALRY